MSYTIIIPVSRHDVNLLPGFLDVYSHLGGTPGFDVLLSVAPSVRHEGHEAADRIRHLCASVNVFVLPSEPRGGWPEACNMQFKGTVTHLLSTKNLKPFYWMELDNTPLRAGWQDELWLEYQRCKKAFMGAVVPTRTKDPVSGRVSTKELSEHMVGTGVYPPAAQYIHLVPIWQSGANQAFDIFTRRDVNKSCHNTSLIQHRWSTVNYREVDGKIICENGPVNEFGTDHSGEVFPEACVLHGCKDGSLANIVLSREAKIAAPPKPSEQAKPGILTAPKEVQQTRSMAPGLFRAVAKEAEPPADQVKAAESTKEKEAEASKVPNASVEIETLRGIVNAKKYMLPHLARELGMDKDALLKIIETPGSGLKIQKPGAPWVRLEAA